MWDVRLVLSGINLLTVACLAHPSEVGVSHQLSRRAVSPDYICGNTGAGNNLGYTCDGSSPCCSQNGWCGSNSDYCGTGCQSAFGTCTTSTPSDTSTRDDLCGPNNGNKKCSDSKCCSPLGYCGTGSDYCQSPDCLRGFGKCDADTTPSGSSTQSIARTLFGGVPYGANIIDCNSPGKVALTYDDGPFTYTTDLLDLFKTRGAKATFFITGINLSKGSIDDPALPWANMIQRMISEGHQVASHTWSHADLSTLTEDDRVSEMVKLEMATRNIIGKFPTYMRPPYSSCNDACMATMKKLGYHIVSFDLDTQDYLHDTPATIGISKDIVANSINSASANDDRLAIMHDIHEQTVHSLTAYVLDVLAAKGFKTVTVGECLGDPAANWYRTST